MRLKHILLPIFVALAFSIYATYNQTQKSKFDPTLWSASLDNDSDNIRLNMLSPLMLHVLKVGMTIENIDDLLGIPNEERTVGCYNWIGGFDYSRVYVIEKKISGVGADY